MFPFFFFDRTMLLLIPALILAVYAQAKVRGAFSRYSQVRARRGATGAQVAQELLRQNGVYDVEVEPTGGTLTDHYDPRKHVLKLSEGVYYSNSVAALGVAAHETGHAVQHALGYFPLALRNGFVPFARFGSMLAFPLFFIGWFFFRSGLLMDIGIILFALAVAFHIVTLPVELNASRRALGMLSSGGYLAQDEVGSARAVLNAAAWTYVASATMAVMQLLRLLMLRGAFGDND